MKWIVNSFKKLRRRKRKWDQPAESLCSVSAAVAGMHSLGNVGGFTLPGVPAVPACSLISPLSATVLYPEQAFLASSVQQHAAALVQKLNQPTIQEELIAREIVINDAESAIRFKLTKRQTQEEIQRCTAAVVITRGKYRPPNAPPDGEKPLYLHISAGAHLETTADRIKAVDRAAAMVEEMLKQGSLSNGVKVTHPLTTSVFLGFEADPSLNIVARIRGPNFLLLIMEKDSNVEAFPDISIQLGEFFSVAAGWVLYMQDQFVNHIMNETGATVVLRGRGSGNSESAETEEGQQPLHLLLSTNNAKSLEHAKLLAENLLDTICAECGASRVSSCKVYGAVPPPQQLLVEVKSSGNNATPPVGLTSSAAGLVPVPRISSVAAPGITKVYSQATVLSTCGQSQPHMVSFPQPSLTGGTSYNGYGGIYPQATPLQQVALVLRQSTSPVTSTVAPATTSASTSLVSKLSCSGKEKRFPQRRKFQELPVVSNGPANPHQVLSLTLYEANRLIVDLFVGSLYEPEFLKQHEPAVGMTVRSISTMPAPKKLVQPLSSGTLCPPRNMLPPPPPPKFNPPPVLKARENNNSLNESKPENVPDTLIRLMEYGDGDEEDDVDEETEKSLQSNSSVSVAPKPFWAV
ncbi:hypothetical protein RJ639_012960 [Escallonia herrerae]|uniref:Protein RIK n=1 Tax=Escallonia herrerae TaxID=1293975 RepID=A0AA88VVU0_9ASTE|nr:hypothetical protein RJ639_012960 [Escallonia herrerae]